MSHIENGRTNITISRIAEIATLLDINPQQVLLDPFELISV